jgi:hypothetical protein
MQPSSSMVPAGFGAGEQHLFEQHKATVAADSMMHNAGVKMAQFTQLFTGGVKGPSQAVEQQQPLPRNAPPLVPSSTSGLARRGSHSSLAATPAESSGQTLSMAAFAGQGSSSATQRSIGRETGSIGRVQGSSLRPGGRATSDAAAAPSFSLAAFSQGGDPHAGAPSGPAAGSSTPADSRSGSLGALPGVGVASPAATGAKVGWNRFVAGFKEVGKLME